jgi:hypothetical protein
VNSIETIALIGVINGLSSRSSRIAAKPAWVPALNPESNSEQR